MVVFAIGQGARFVGEDQLAFHVHQAIQLGITVVAQKGIKALDKEVPEFVVKSSLETMTRFDPRALWSAVADAIDRRGHPAPLALRQLGPDVLADRRLPRP